MDFIEQWLHISPDGGNGALEAIYLGTGLAIAAGIIAARRFTKRRSRDNG
jgi:hypothetical protein